MKADTFLIEGDKLVMKHFGKSIIIFAISYLLFNEIIGVPGLLSFILSILTSYYILRFINNKQTKKKKQKSKSK